MCDICYAFKTIGEKCDHKCKVLTCEKEFISYLSDGYCEDHRCHFERGFSIWDKPPKCSKKKPDDRCTHQISQTFRPTVKCDSCGPVDDQTEPETYGTEDPVKYRERAANRRDETTYVDRLWTPFCACHLCKQFGCLGRVWKKTDFCKKHGFCHCSQPKARRRNMHHRCLVACEAHLCQGMSYDSVTGEFVKAICARCPNV